MNQMTNKSTEMSGIIVLLVAWAGTYASFSLSYVCVSFTFAAMVRTKKTIFFYYVSFNSTFILCYAFANIIMTVYDYATMRIVHECILYI